MADVNVDINGRTYRLACEDGQEEHLLGLANALNRQIEGFKHSFGEIGDNRLIVMAGIAVLDELAEMRGQITKLEKDIVKLKLAGEAMHKESEELEVKFAKRLSEAARKIEAVAQAIDETSAPTDQGQAS